MIFVDSGAWIALLNRRDQHHDDAAAILDSLGQQKAQLLTTDYVIDETVTWLRYRVNHAIAVQFLDLIESSSTQSDKFWNSYICRSYTVECPDTCSSTIYRH